MKALTNYLKVTDKKFDFVQGQIIIKREFIDYDLRQVINEHKLNVYELDTIFVIY